jgi:ornithine cyclodeaminase
MLLITESQIRQLLDAESCIVAVEQAFTDYAAGRAELPNVIHLDVPDHGGEVHVKAGYVRGQPYYAVKMASGFPRNAGHGMPTGDGMVVVFDAYTGAPAALLLDRGYITDLRTAAAGAVAVKHLARETIDAVGVVGTGIQARLQVRLLARVRALRVVRIWGRNAKAAAKCAADIRDSGDIPGGALVTSVPTIEQAVEGTDVVFTVTPSQRPLVEAAWIRPGCLVVAVGSDGSNKQELEVAVLERADRVVADSLAQCRRIGEIHHALDAGKIRETKITELGQITAGASPGRQRDDEIIVCDLTGVGVQDVAAASVVVDRARSRGLGSVL